MVLAPFERKLALTAHVTASVGWIGALAVFLAHAIASLVSEGEQIVRAAALAMSLTAWFVILPLCIATVVTGLVQALGTGWGLTRHYWVLFKLVLTAIATSVLLLKLQPISHLAEAAGHAAFSTGDVAGLRMSLTLHAAGGLLILLSALVLAIYKPAGLTAWAAPAARAPRWARILASLLAVFIALTVVMAFFGSHGPGVHSRNAPSGGTGYSVFTQSNWRTIPADA